MAGVTGIGGVFFKARDVDAMAEWYRTHLGMVIEKEGYSAFNWASSQSGESSGSTVWALFPKDTPYFGTGHQPFMVNYRVDDLDALLLSLREAGVEVDDHVEELENGRFGWCTDPEGNRLELWEPHEL